MKFLKHILITALTFSLITQSFAAETARAMDVVRKSYAGRMAAYNEDPTNNIIPRYTGTLNQLFAKKPSARPASKEEKEDILKAVMGAALIHGDNMSLPAHGVSSKDTSIYRHHEIIRITQELSQRLAGSIIDNDFSAIDQIDGFDGIDLLKTYGGIEIDKLKTWFKDVYNTHTGLLHRDGTGGYWRNPALYKKQKPAVILDDGPDLSAAIAASKRSLIEKRKELKPFIQFTEPSGRATHLEHYHIPGTGDCGFLAINKTRDEVASAVEVYFTNHASKEVGGLKDMLSGDLKEATLSNTSDERLLSDEEIRNLFSGNPNAATKKASIKKITDRIRGNEYVAASILAICAKMFKFNLHTFTVDANGEAIWTAGFAQEDFKQPRTDNDILILSNGKAGANAHYDLLVDPGYLYADVERTRAAQLERDNLGQNLDRRKLPRVMPAHDEGRLKSAAGGSTENRLMLSEDDKSLTFNGRAVPLEKKGSLIAEYNLRRIFNQTKEHEQIVYEVLREKFGEPACTDENYSILKSELEKILRPIHEKQEAQAHQKSAIREKIVRGENPFKVEDRFIKLYTDEMDIAQAMITYNAKKRERQSEAQIVKDLFNTNFNIRNAGIGDDLYPFMLEAFRSAFLSQLPENVKQQNQAQAVVKREEEIQRRAEQKPEDARRKPREEKAKQSLSFAEESVLRNVGERHDDYMTMLLSERSMRDIYQMFSDLKKDDSPYAALNLFTDSPLMGDPYGRMGELAFFLTEQEWIREQQGRPKTGFLGMQRGHPYNFSHAELGRAVPHTDSINQFIDDAEAAFTQDYTSYVGVIRNGRPGESAHYHTFFVTKSGAGNTIANAYVFNPSANSNRDVIRDDYDYKYLLLPFKNALGARGINLGDVSQNAFSTGLQSGSMACGLASSMIAKHFASFTLGEINTREKVIAKLKELQQRFGYTDDQLDRTTNLYDATKLPDGGQAKNRQLRDEETRFGDRIVAICDEIYDLTRAGTDLADAIQQWIHQGEGIIAPQRREEARGGGAGRGDNRSLASSGGGKKRAEPPVPPPAPKVEAVKYQYIDAAGNVKANGRTYNIDMAANYYYENGMVLESAIKQVLTNLFPMGADQTTKPNVEKEIRSKFAEMSIS